MDAQMARRPDRALLTFSVVAITLVGSGLVLSQLLGRNSYGIDFDVYRAAGGAVVHHHSLFGPWVVQQTHRRFTFTYPPFAALFAVPFALLGDIPAYAMWIIASIVTLIFVVRASSQPLLRRSARPAVTLAILVAVALSLTPVQDEIVFGQVGIMLMALCLFDCLLERPPLPRGIMVGVATAVKLAPAIFIPYLWLSGRRRAAIVAMATTALLTLSGFAVLPHDSRTFWTSSLFDNSRVGDNALVSNQSLNGMLRRAFGTHAQMLWLVLAIAVAVYGLRRAALASRNGHELLGIVITALVGIAVSPVSWIHHMVWIVPILALILGDATNRRRVVVALSLAGLFALRLPYVGDNIPHSWHVGLLAGLLMDSYGLLALGLLFFFGSAASTQMRGSSTHRPNTSASASTTSPRVA